MNETRQILNRLAAAGRCPGEGSQGKNCQGHWVGKTIPLTILPRVPADRNAVGVRANGAALMKVCALILLALAASTGSLAAPFVLPWNDSLPGVSTDFSAMNPPIGPASQLTVDANAHFAAMP